MLQRIIDKYHKQRLRFCKIFICALCVCLLLLLALTFDIYFSLWNAISFALLFIGLPILLFVCLRKNEDVKWYVLVSILVSIPLLVWIYCSNLLCVNSNFDTYLAGDAKFVNAAETVLPSKNLAQKEQVLFFEHLYYLDGEFEMYRLAVNYSDADFEEEKERLQTQYRANTIEVTSANLTPYKDDFFFDGARYSCYTFFHDKTDYAMAYHLCEETSTISYIFFTDRICLSTMTAGATLRFFYEDTQYGSAMHFVREAEESLL